MPSSKYTFNVILDKPDEEHLIALANKLRVSRGAFVRKVIDAAYHHVILEVPTCADGSRCFVPGMHTRPPAPQPSPPKS